MQWCINIRVMFLRCRIILRIERGGERREREEGRDWFTQGIDGEIITVSYKPMLKANTVVTR